MGRDRHLVGAECRHLGARGYTKLAGDCGNDGVLVLARSQGHIRSRRFGGKRGRSGSGLIGGRVRVSVSWSISACASSRASSLASHRTGKRQHSVQSHRFVVSPLAVGHQALKPLHQVSRHAREARVGSGDREHMGRDRHLVGAECRHLGARGYTEVTCDCGNDGVLVLAWGFLVGRGAGWYLGRLFHRSIVHWRGWYVIHRRLVENV